MNAEEEKALRDKIAYDIRAELVCCDMYNQVQKYSKSLGDPAYIHFKDIPGYHGICHWAEAAARIAENPTK